MNQKPEGKRGKRHDCQATISAAHGLVGSRRMKAVYAAINAAYICWVAAGMRAAYAAINAAYICWVAAGMRAAYAAINAATCSAALRPRASML